MSGWEEDKTSVAAGLWEGPITSSGNVHRPPNRWFSQEVTQPKAKNHWKENSAIPHAELLVILGENKDARVVIHKTPFWVGRSLENDFIIHDITVSKKHFVVEFSDEGGFVVRDLGSGNGTLIDGSHSDSGKVVRDGDVIDLGHTHLAFRSAAFKAKSKKRPKPPPIPRTAVPAPPVANTPRSSGSDNKLTVQEFPSTVSSHGKTTAPETNVPSQIPISASAPPFPPSPPAAVPVAKKYEPTIRVDALSRNQIAVANDLSIKPSRTGLYIGIAVLVVAIVAVIVLL